MKLLVGISENLGGHRHDALHEPSPTPICCPPPPHTHPISRKICRNCVRTFISGCRWPESGSTPRAAKL